MTTIEQTGAEEVAWDLSDLYASGDDPRIESDITESEAAADAFRDRYYGKVATLSAADLAAAIDELERIESIATRALYYAHMEFSTNMADSARGALVAKLGEKAAGIETKLLFFGLEWAAIEDERADELLQDPGARRLAALAHGPARLPSLPPHRAGGEDRHGEGSLGRLRVVAALRGGTRRDPRRPGGRARARRARDGDGEALLAPTGTSAAPRPRP